MKKPLSEQCHSPTIEMLSQETMECPLCKKRHPIIYLDAWPLPIFFLRCNGTIINVMFIEKNKWMDNKEKDTGKTP